MSTTTSEVDSVSVMSDEINEETTSQNEEPNVDLAQRLSKKMQRRLRRKEQWLANKTARRLREREKLKKKREAARLNNVELGPSRKKLKESTMAQSNCKVRVAVDMDFDDLMNPKDLGKCVKQLMRCYTLNRRAENPLQIYFTSFTGKSESEMSKNSGYKNWDVNIHEESYLEIFNKEDIIYLTSESHNVLSALDDSKVYIIGGLVDHNAHKGICFHRAEEKKLCHAQLPISDFLEMQTRKVLTIDHVFEILLGVSAGLSWRDAFLKVIPQRKGATDKTVSNCGSLEASNDDADCTKPEQCENSPVDGNVSMQPIKKELIDTTSIADKNILCHSADVNNIAVEDVSLSKYDCDKSNSSKNVNEVKLES